MNKLTMAALLLASACGAAKAGSATATMEVSFVIRAACTVQADAGSPQVACSQGTGYQVVRQQSAPAATTAAAQAPSSSAQSGEVWQVVF